jgi:hypothetical protein
MAGWTGSRRRSGSGLTVTRKRARSACPTRREVAQVGRARLGFGAAAWGAAQPGIARVDVGPQAVLHLPLGPAGARLSAEYRFRVAGKARPANGISITLGADF